MKKATVSLAVIGAAIASRPVTKRVGQKLHERLMAGCERMFEQMPDTFPPKRMMRGIEEVRASTARTLELLEEREKASKSQPLGDVYATTAAGDSA